MSAPVLTATRAAPPTPLMQRAQQHLARWLAGTTGILSIAVAAELLIRTGVLPERYIPAPTSVIADLAGLFIQQSFWVSVGYTIQGWAFGLGLIVLTAIPLGLLLGTTRAAYAFLRWPIEFLRPIPPIALLPVTVLIYGNTMSMKVSLVVVGAFWPLLIQTVYGVQDTDPVTRDTARVYGLGRFAMVRRIVFPSAMPFIATGLRISSTIALVLAVGAEFIVGVPGLGADMMIAYNSSAVVTTYALVVAAGLLGVATSFLMRRLERITLHWHPSQRLGHTS